MVLNPLSCFQRDTAKAKSAYQDFLTLWKDADPDIPILKEAKAEYAKLQSQEKSCLLAHCLPIRGQQSEIGIYQQQPFRDTANSIASLTCWFYRRRILLQ